MPPGPPDALAEPLGVVVGLVQEIDPAVAPEVVEEVVKSLAARRATRRRLAQALSARPAVLVDGASPAPAIVGDLLVGLRKGGDGHLRAALRGLRQGARKLPSS